MGGNKIGRNDPCPCGSGKKYKKCCLGRSQPQPMQEFVVPQTELPPAVRAEIQRRISERQREEAERVMRFGYGRPMISTEFQGRRLVVVGGKIHHSSGWKTFHDFLNDYIKIVTGEAWGTEELKKPLADRHPILQWYQAVCELQARTIKEPGKVHSVAATGPTMAFTALAYDLYTLEHEALLQSVLVERLKNKTNFQGARYETFVAATFVRAGFHIELEDEADPTTTHCEFNATHSATGLKYSVEAKSRHRPGYLGQPGTPKPLDEIEADVGRLIRRALQKEAKNQRIIFIDVNIPPIEATSFDAEWFRRLDREVKRVQSSQSTDEPLTAFVYFTNHPYHYVGNEEPEPQSSVVLTTLNIPALDPMNLSVLEKDYPAINELLYTTISRTTIPHEFPPPDSPIVG